MGFHTVVQVLLPSLLLCLRRCGRGDLHEAPLQSYFVLFQVLAKDDS